MSLCIRLGEEVLEQFDADDLAAAVGFDPKTPGVAEIVHIESGAVLAIWCPESATGGPGGWWLTPGGEAFKQSGSEVGL